jgi:hypothetical protein
MIREIGYQPGELLSFFERRGYRMYLLRRGRPLAALPSNAAPTKNDDDYVDIVATRRDLG